MKSVMIDADWFDEPMPYTMLENLDDFQLYVEITQNNVAKSFDKVIRSGVPNDRLAHILGKNDGDGILLTALIVGQAQGGNFLQTISKVVGEKLSNIMMSIVGGETVIINHVGGYCFLTDDMVVISEKPYDNTPDKSTYVIAESASYMNLENDDVLEDRTHEFFAERQANLSYVLNLRNFKKQDLVKIFTEFVTNGGEALYVYTTGMDVPQMYDYSDAAIEADIERVLFEFNAGKDPEHENVIKHLEAHGVLVQCV